MGGWCSTRWNAHHKRLTVEECCSLDASERVRQGALTVWTLRQNILGQWVRCPLQARVVSRSGRAGELAVTVGQRDMPQYIALQATPQHLGGVRWWFTCPACDRRCGKLYLTPASAMVRCRVCHDLTYRSAQMAHVVLDPAITVERIRTWTARMAKRLT